jgi:hypothetical protein
LAKFTQIKRKLIGGIWIKNKEELNFIYCIDRQNGWLSSFNPIKRVHSGFGRTNVGIETIEDYGSVTALGKLFGYSDHCSIVQRKSIFSFIDGNEIFMYGLFLFFLFLLLSQPLCN